MYRNYHQIKPDKTGPYEEAIYDTYRLFISQCSFTKR